MSSVLVGMFDTQSSAAQARDKLIGSGFSSSAVSLTGGASSTSSGTGSSSSGTLGMESSSSSAEPHQEGTITHFFKSLFGSDSDDGLDANRAGYTDTYNEAFKRGSYGVSVTAASDDEMDTAERILNECGAIDIDEKAESWRKEGWMGGTVAAATGAGAGAGAGAMATGTSSTLDAGSTVKLKEVEEELKVGKRAVARGGVRVFTRVVEVPTTETVRLREEHANVKRTAIDRPATEADLAAFKEGSIEVREMAEEAVVSKSARVVGEVEVGKTATERDETVRETLRKTKVDVEQLEGSMAGSTSGSTASGSMSGGTTSASLDPLSGEHGAHPVGTGIGAATGGIAAGAAAGSVVGPVGTVVGAAVGAVAGGLAGKGVAETIDPTTKKDKY